MGIICYLIFCTIACLAIAIHFLMESTTVKDETESFGFAIIFIAFFLLFLFALISEIKVTPVEKVAKYEKQIIEYQSKIDNIPEDASNNVRELLILDNQKEIDKIQKKIDNIMNKERNKND